MLIAWYICHFFLGEISFKIIGSILGKQAQISQQPTSKTKQAPKIPQIFVMPVAFESGLLFHVLYAGYTAFTKGSVKLN